MPLNLDGFFPYRLSVLSDRIGRELAQVYGPRHGIGQPEWRVMAHLATCSGGLSVRDIHARINLEKPRVTRAVQRLEAAGLVSKKPSKSDRRLIAVALSDKGRALYESIVPDALAFQENLLGALSDDERAVLDRAISRLTARLAAPTDETT